MIIETQDDVTAAVLGEMHRTPNARTRELLALFVKHLHAFVREAKLTEREFQDAIGYVNAIGKQTTPSHNEAMLLARLPDEQRLARHAADAGQQPRAVLPCRCTALCGWCLHRAFADAGRCAAVQGVGD